jgi:hypothetical protein
VLRTVEGRAGEHRIAAEERRILVAVGEHRIEAGERRILVAAEARRIDWEEGIVRPEGGMDYLVAAEVDRILHTALAEEVVRRILVAAEARRIDWEEGIVRPEGGMGCLVAAVGRIHIDLEVVEVDRSRAVEEEGDRSPVGRGLDTDCMT